MQHLDEGTIHAWLDGALSSEESARVEQHTRQCAECSAMVADARGFIAGASRIVSALDVVPGGVIPKTNTPATAPSVWRRLHLTPFRAALAASLMVAVGSMFAVRQSEFGAARETSVLDSSPRPSVAAPSPPPVRALQAEAASSSASVPVDRRSGAANASARREVLEKAKVAADVATSPLSDTSRRVAEAARDAAAPAAAAPAAAAPAQVAADRARQDSTRSSLAQARVAGADRVGGRATEPVFRRAAGLRATNSSGFAPSDDFAGCYRVSGDSASWPRPLPSRFVLETDTSSAARQQKVRGLDFAGRADTSVAGSWRPTGVGSVLVTLTNRDQQAMFSLTRGLGAMTAQRLDAPIRPIPVVRESCRP